MTTVINSKKVLDISSFCLGLREQILFFEMIRYLLNFQETSEDLYPAAAKNVIHHLEKLVKEGKVKQDEDLFWTS